MERGQTEEAVAATVKITCNAADNVNVAFYQNAVPIMRELAVENGLGRDLTDISVHLDVRTAVSNSRRLAHRPHRRPSHPPYSQPRPEARSCSFSPALMRRAAANCVSTSKRPASVLAEHTVEINLLPPSHWGGVNSAPELLAAFVRPTDPSVDVILREASGKLAAAGRDEAMDGYRKGTKARAWEIADAIWAALVSHSIAYVLPPKSFERSGQMVRGPSDILSRKVGTCLDLTLLYASCLEQAGLNPVLALTEGHSFVGIWLVDEDFSGLVIDDPQMLRKRVQLEEMVVVETTLLTGVASGALQAGRRGRQEADRRGRGIAVRDSPSTSAARAAPRSVRSISSGSAEPAIRPVTTTVTAQEVGEIPQFEEDLDKRREPVPERNLDRLEIWKRNLLDLTLKNRLLNFKDSKSTIAIECPDPAALEDKLSDGERFKLLGKATVLDGSDGRDPRCSPTGRTRTDARTSSWMR